MIVCLCRGVSQKKVLEVIDSGARSVSEIARSCGAGSDCGSCVPMLQQMLDAKSSDKHPSAARPQSVPGVAARS